MLKGFDENGNLQNVQVTEEGAILTKIAGGEDDGLEINIKNASKLNIKEKTLYAGVQTLGTSEITVGVNDIVSELSIANYSETANVSVSIDNKTFVIAPGLALDLPINDTVGTIGLSATEASTKIQYVIKGLVSNSSETIEITSNGTYDVRDYSTAHVNALSQNVFDKEDVENGYLNNNGEVVSNNSFKVSNYIEIPNNVQYVVMIGNSGDGEVVSFYNASKEHVSSTGTGENVNYIIAKPATSSYVRATAKATDINDLKLYFV